MDWLDEIEAQLDSTVPYYVPRLIAEIRRLRAIEAQRMTGDPFRVAHDVPANWDSHKLFAHTNPLRAK